MSKKASSITSRNSDSNALNGLEKRQSHLICNWLPLSSFHHQFLRREPVRKNPSASLLPFQTCQRMCAGGNCDRPQRHAPRVFALPQNRPRRRTFHPSRLTRHFRFGSSKDILQAFASKRDTVQRFGSNSVRSNVSGGRCQRSPARGCAQVNLRFLCRGSRLC